MSFNIEFLSVVFTNSENNHSRYDSQRVTKCRPFFHNDFSYAFSYYLGLRKARAGHIPPMKVPFTFIENMPQSPLLVRYEHVGHSVIQSDGLGDRTTGLFSQCRAKVQNLLQFANNFTTFNDKRKANKKMIPHISRRKEPNN